MSRPRSIPSYRLHRQSGQAVVTLSDSSGRRRDYLLGPFNSPESREAYARVLLEHKTLEGRLPPKPGETGYHADMSLNELMLAYVRYAASYYVKDGLPTKEQEVIRLALRFMKPYGDTPASNFGPLSLRAVRDAMIGHQIKCKTKEGEKVVREGLSRKTINRQISRIKAMFKWAVGQELVPADTYHRLVCVEGLRRGKSGARERPRVKPVADDTVNITLPHLPSVVGDMVRLQRLTGARPGEVVQLRAVDIDRSADVWEFRPGRHKTEHHDRERIIFIGPQAQAILREYLRLEMSAPLFRPDLSEECRNLEKRKSRTTPLTPSAMSRRARQSSRGRAGSQYDVHAYRRAIARACQKAAVPVWTPNQLRHSAATEVRKRFGLEAAQAVLGHAQLGVTQVYAEKDLAAAKRVMAEIG
jgi:integrase